MKIMQVSRWMLGCLLSIPMLSVTAGPGPLVSVSGHGVGTPLAYNVCLDGRNAISCGQYTAAGSVLTIAPVPNRTYVNMSAQVMTPGYQINPQSCPGGIINGRCVFTASPTSPAAILVAPTPQCGSPGGICYIFRTSFLMTGDLTVVTNPSNEDVTACASTTGLDRANCLCQVDTTGQQWRYGQASGTFKAWLSTSTTNAATNIGNLPSTSLYLNAKGDIVFFTETTADRLGGCGALQNPVATSGSFLALTNTACSGEKISSTPSATCSDFTSTSGTSWIGNTASTSATQWTQWFSDGCDQQFALICVQTAS